MYELKKNGKVFTSKFVGTGPSSYKKSIYPAAVSQRLRNTALEDGITTLSRNVGDQSPRKMCYTQKKRRPELIS